MIQCVIGRGIVNEWGVTPSFITAWAEWSVSLVSLSTTSLQTMPLCPSDPPPNQMQFCCFYSQLEHLSLSLSFSGSSFSSVWPEQHARSSHDTLRGLFVRTQARKESLWLQRQRTSGCVNALRLNVSVAVWQHTCDPVHNECVCVWVFYMECVYV